MLVLFETAAGYAVFKVNYLKYIVDRYAEFNLIVPLNDEVCKLIT